MPRALGIASIARGTSPEFVFLNQGYPQVLKHFIECVREDKPPLVTGEDGRAVLEILCAAYWSARIGQKVALPFHPKVSKPIDLWLNA